MGWRQRPRRPALEELERQRREATGRLYATASLLFRQGARIMAEGMPRPIDFDDDVRALGAALNHFGRVILGESEKGDRDGSNGSAEQV